MRFEWDATKANADQRKHGVSFDDATEVFYDPYALQDYDPTHSDAEARFFIIGLSSRRLLYVVCAERSGDVVRMARRADGSERKFYERERSR